MSVIKGQNLRVMLGTKCIALATSCTLHVATSLQDSTTKDSVSDFDNQEVTGLSWDLTVDALYGVNSTDTTGEYAPDLLSSMLAKTEVSISFTQTKGEDNRTADTAGITVSGKAFITDLSINAQAKQNASYNAKFTGNGALTVA